MKDRLKVIGVLFVLLYAMCCCGYRTTQADIQKEKEIRARMEYKREVDNSPVESGEPNHARNYYNYRASKGITHKYD